MCDKCKKYTIKEYKNCPKCGDELFIFDRDNYKGVIFSCMDYTKCKYWLMRIFRINEYEFDILWFKYLNECYMNNKGTIEFIIEEDMLFIVNKINCNTKNIIDENSKLYKLIITIKNTESPINILSESQKIKYLLHKIEYFENILSQQ